MPSWAVWLQQKIRKTPSRARKLHPTSFLDGLRGVSALIVCVFHYYGLGHQYLNDSYGSNPSTLYLQLPIVRIVYNGKAMVHIFFIISGYVLSLKLLELVRSGSYEKFGDRLFSSTFRRGIRIFLPCIAGIAFWDFTYWLGWQPAWIVAGTATPLTDFWRTVVVLVSDPLAEHYTLSNVQLRHLWTIPVEFWGSMILFVTILGLSRVHTVVRLFVTLCVIILTLFWVGHWGLSEFLSGMFLAEMEMIMNSRTNKAADDDIEGFESNSEKINSVNSTRAMQTVISKTFWAINLLIALILCSWPEYGPETTPIFKDLLPMTPEVYNGNRVNAFWYNIAAVQIMCALFRIPILQKIFTTRFAQYLGDISFSIYIMHDYVVVALREKYLSPLATRLFYDLNTSPHRYGSLIVEIGIFLFICMWIADIFERLIDTPSVNFSRWLEAKCRRG
jgi:peptidoglycan/LPS O-acetylase OafA/YrhL